LKPIKVNEQYFEIVLRSLDIGARDYGRHYKLLMDNYFPLCSIEEQIRIVKKYDELMALCDKLEVQQRQKRKLQNQLRQSTIQAVATATSPFELEQHWQRLHTNFDQLFSFPEDVKELQNLVVDLTVNGKLSEKPNKLNKQNVSDLIGRFKNIKSGKRFAKASKPDELFNIPSGWKWVLLEDLLSGSESGWSPKCHPEPRQKEEWGVLKVSAVTWGVFNHDENKALPLSLEPRPESETCAGDFLLSRANTAELVARSVIVPKDTPKRLMMSDKIVRLLFIDDNLKAWVNLANNSSYARDYYYQRATGTSDSMRNVSRQVLHELPIPLPSLEEQNSALEIMDNYFDLCRLLEEKIRKKVNLAENLAITAIAKLTGIQATQKEESLKTPITELVAPVLLGSSKPSNKDAAPLATLLVKQDGKMNANDLWQSFGGEIDTFYAQLKTEIKHGWIAEPTKADMLEKDPE
jgi:type I restriction enzyme S subunit